MPFGYDARVELRHLRYFVTVAASQNFTQAARQLRVAQPALSRQIHDLEDELGVTLLERGPRPDSPSRRTRQCPAPTSRSARSR